MANSWPYCARTHYRWLLERHCRGVARRLSSLVSNRRGASNHAAVAATPPVETVPVDTGQGVIESAMAR